MLGRPGGVFGSYVHFTVFCFILRYFWKRRRFFLLFSTCLSDVNYASLLIFERLLCLFSMTVRCNAQREWFFRYFFHVVGL